MRGETVILIDKVKTGTDAFGADVYSETEITVNDVIIGTPSTDDVVSDLNIYGKQLLFVLGIPKGDTHNWKDKMVMIRGDKYRTYGFPLVQTEANVPGRWNAQVKVERYE